MKTRRMIGLVVAFVLGIVTLSLQADVQAQQGVINLDETVIKGRIQKPEVFYILQHANFSYEKMTLKKSFMPDLLKTVEEKPF